MTRYRIRPGSFLEGLLVWAILLLILIGGH